MMMGARGVDLSPGDIRSFGRKRICIWSQKTKYASLRACTSLCRQNPKGAGVSETMWQ